MKRREFINYSIKTAAGLTLFGGSIFALPPGAGPQVIKVTGGEPAELLRAALQAYGGMSRFVSRNDVVVVKPNIGWDRRPEFAANTNPELVAEVVKACFDAGAKKVKVFDYTCNNPRRCYVNSGIEAAVKPLGADIFNVRSFKFKKVRLPEGELVKEWPIYQDYLEADKVINVPIAKHHSMARVTLGLKNLMGVMGDNRGKLHNHFSKKLIDVDMHLLPTLTIIDAYRILVRNGPVGGNLADVKLTKTLIVSDCTVSADFTALDLFGRKLDEIGYLQEAYRRNLNKYSRENLQVQEISLS